MIIGRGDPRIFLESPISLVSLLLALGVILLMAQVGWRGRARQPSPTGRNGDRD
mgnify:CR=1 FL=1